tara:strand:+ start:39 stop:212 length:174 start_codon:yes stop_codon:yes gene_type:complete
MTDFKWAATETFTFKDPKKFIEYGEAVAYAKERRPYANSVYIWKLTTGQPIKWVENP